MRTMMLLLLALIGALLSTITAGVSLSELKGAKLQLLKRGAISADAPINFSKLLGGSTTPTVVFAVRRPG